MKNPTPREVFAKKKRRCFDYHSLGAIKNEFLQKHLAKFSIAKQKRLLNNLHIPKKITAKKILSQKYRQIKKFVFFLFSEADETESAF